MQVHTCRWHALYLQWFRRCIYKKINYPSLILAQPRKTRLYVTERLLMGRKESNQSNLIRLLLGYRLPPPPPPPPPPPLGNVGPPLDPWKSIVFSDIKPLDPLCKLYNKLRTKKKKHRCPGCWAWTPWQKILDQCVIDILLKEHSTSPIWVHIVCNTVQPV